MDILYFDPHQRTANEVLSVVKQLSDSYDEDRPLIVIPKDYHYLEDASYSDLVQLKIMIERVLEDKKNNLSSE